MCGSATPSEGVRGNERCRTTSQRLYRQRDDFTPSKGVEKTCGSATSSEGVRKMRGLATPSGWESGAGSVGRCASFEVPPPCSDRTPRSRKHLIFKGCHKSHVLSSILKPHASTRQIINKLSVRTLSNHSVRTILFRSATERATATSCTQQQVPSQPHRPSGVRRTPHRAQPARPAPRSIITTDTINTTSLHDRHRNHEPYEDSEQRTVIDIITHPARKPLPDREVMTAATDPQPAAPTSWSTPKLTPNTPPRPAAETDTETNTKTDSKINHHDRHHVQPPRLTPCTRAHEYVKRRTEVY